MRIENQKATINNKVRAIEQKLMLDPKVKQILAKESFTVFTSFNILINFKELVSGKFTLNLSLIYQFAFPQDFLQ